MSRCDPGPTQSWHSLVGTNVPFTAFTQGHWCNTLDLRQTAHSSYSALAGGHCGQMFSSLPRHFQLARRHPATKWEIHFKFRRAKAWRCTHSADDKIRRGPNPQWRLHWANQKWRKYRTLWCLVVSSYTIKHHVFNHDATWAVMRRFLSGVFSSCGLQDGERLHNRASGLLLGIKPKHSGGKMWNSCCISDQNQSRQEPHVRMIRPQDIPGPQSLLPRVYESHLAWAFKSYCQASQLFPDFKTLQGGYCTGVLAAQVSQTFCNSCHRKPLAQHVNQQEHQTAERGLPLVMVNHDIVRFYLWIAKDVPHTEAISMWRGRVTKRTKARTRSKVDKVEFLWVLVRSFTCAYISLSNELRHDAWDPGSGCSPEPLAELTVQNRRTANPFTGAR